MGLPTTVISHCMQRVGERRGAADPLGRPALRRNGDRTGHRNQARTHRTALHVHAHSDARARVHVHGTARRVLLRSYNTTRRTIAYACACRHAVAHALGSVWMRSYVHARSWSDEWISLGLATYGAKLCLRELAGTRSAAQWSIVLPLHAYAERLSRSRARAHTVRCTRTRRTYGDC